MAHEHGGMDHGGHMCNMNMLFTWDTTDLCIIFRSWHVRSNASLVWALLGVVALTAGYELVREISRQYESRMPDLTGSIIDDPETRSLIRPERTVLTSGSVRKSKTIKALLYASQVFYSFFIMLLFMTYNGWVMLAVAAGAFLGYMLFSNSSASKSVACH